MKRFLSEPPFDRFYYGDGLRYATDRIAIAAEPAKPPDDNPPEDRSIRSIRNAIPPECYRTRTDYADRWDDIIKQAAVNAIQLWDSGPMVVEYLPLRVEVFDPRYLIKIHEWMGRPVRSEVSNYTHIFTGDDGRFVVLMQLRY